MQRRDKRLKSRPCGASSPVSPVSPVSRRRGGHPRGHSLSGGSSPASGQSGPHGSGLSKTHAFPSSPHSSNRALDAAAGRAALASHAVLVDRVREGVVRPASAVRGLLARLVAPAALRSADVAFVDEVDVQQLAGPARVRLAFDENVERGRAARRAHQDRIDVIASLPRTGRTSRASPRGGGGALGRDQPSHRAHMSPSSREMRSGRAQRQAKITPPENVPRVGCSRFDDCRWASVDANDGALDLRRRLRRGPSRNERQPGAADVAVAKLPARRRRAPGRHGDTSRASGRR